MPDLPNIGAIDDMRSTLTSIFGASALDGWAHVG